MEMPEGWYAAFNYDTSTDEGRDRLDKMVYLLKEMAEALEPFAFPSDAWGILKTDDFKKAIEVLRKFKELK